MLVIPYILSLGLERGGPSEGLAMLKDRIEKEEAEGEQQA